MSMQIPHALGKMLASPMGVMTTMSDRRRMLQLALFATVLANDHTGLHARL
jgi:hypothetical protein